MTEHAAVIFVFFFLAEYASIVLICMLNTILFLGGYLYYIDLSPFYSFFNIQDTHMLDPWTINFLTYISGSSSPIDNSLIEQYSLKTLDSSSEGLYYALSFSVKSCLMIFLFIWVRASFPRIRYDQLMSFCWTILLPVIIAFIVLVPCILYSFEIIPVNINLL